MGRETSETTSVISQRPWTMPFLDRKATIHVARNKSNNEERILLEWNKIWSLKDQISETLKKEVIKNISSFIRLYEEKKVN